MTHADTPSEQIERQIESKRAEINRRIDRMQEKLRSGEMLEEALGPVRDASAKLAAGVGRTVRQNPIPVALIGIGIGWLLVAGRNSDTGGGEPVQDRIGRTARSAAHSVRAGAAGAAARTEELRGRAASGLRDARARAEDLAGQAGEQARRTGRAAGDFAQDNPLLVAGLAVAAGAALAAMLPQSRRENALMGRRSEEFRETAEEAVREGVGRARSAAAAGLEAAREEAFEGDGGKAEGGKGSGGKTGTGGTGGRPASAS